MTTQHDECARLIAEAREIIADLTSGEFQFPDERATELAERLVASGSKANAVSASECHEIADAIFSAYANEAAPVRSAAALRAMAGQLEAAGRAIERLTRRVRDQDEELTAHAERGHRQLMASMAGTRLTAERDKLQAELEAARREVERLADVIRDARSQVLEWSNTTMFTLARANLAVTLDDALEGCAARDRAGERAAGRLAISKEHIRTVVDNAVIDVASIGPKLSATNLRMMSAAIADRVADALVSLCSSAPSAPTTAPDGSNLDEESDYEKRNRELHRLGRLAGKP